MSDTEKSKIIIDEDWKSQVEKEREELDKRSEESSDDMPEMGEIPPASLPMLVTAIATQAMMALGQVPDPMTGKAIYHPELARHHIDTLAVLQEKTSGNLTPDETAMFDDFLNQLRRMFLSAQASMQMPPSTPPPSGL